MAGRKEFRSAFLSHEHMAHYLINRTIRAVIFDLDGSLMDSMWVWTRIDVDYLAHFGIAVPDDLQKEIGGMSMRETAVFFKKRFHIPDSIEQMQDDWNAMAWEHYTHDVFPKPGAAAFLAACRKRGIRCGIASSNSRELVDQVLTARGLASYFGCVVTGSEVEHGKPSPDIYLQAAKGLDTPPAECLVFEDIPDGILAAHAAGMTCVAVHDARSASQEEEIRSLSDGYITDFREVSFQ